MPISICIVDKALPSPEFVTTPLVEASSPTHVSPPRIESPASSIKACLFNSLEDILILFMIFTQLLTLTSYELVDANVDATSSLTLAIGEAPSATLVIVLLWWDPRSPYDQDWEDDDLIVEGL